MASPGATQDPERRNDQEGSADVATAKADAARRTGTVMEAWEVVHVAPRNWPDASLGCPAPGGIYAQVVTPGFLIQLSAGSWILEYHTGASRVEYCSG